MDDNTLRLKPYSNSSLRLIDYLERVLGKLILGNRVSCWSCVFGRVVQI